MQRIALQMTIENEYVYHNPALAVPRAFTRKTKTNPQIDPFAQEEMNAVVPLLDQDDKYFFLYVGTASCDRARSLR